MTNRVIPKQGKILKEVRKMEIKQKEDIKEAVRKTYGNVARIDSIAASVDQAAACCDTSCCGSQPISPEQLSAVMGYSNEEMASVPEGANLGLGCGNPLAVASLKEGETVVDLGSGGGFDCFLAAREVGETGQVIGVDMTPDMISKARKNAEKAGIPHVEFRL
jgi:arsenite methyltransferase